MRYRIIFMTGLGIGFVLGARAGRERYDQIAKIARQTWESPAVQQAAGALQAQASEFAKTTRDKMAGSVPGMANTARSKAGQAASHFPGRNKGSRNVESDGRGQYSSTAPGGTARGGPATGGPATGGPAPS